MTKEQEDQFDVLRKIKTKPKATQRELAKDLGFSIGKLNYCVKALQKKGLIKLDNFIKSIILITNIILIFQKTTN